MIHVHVFAQDFLTELVTYTYMYYDTQILNQLFLPHCITTVLKGFIIGRNFNSIEGMLLTGAL